MTTWQYKFTPFIRRRKHFVSLIFVVEGDRRQFLRPENFPNYGSVFNLRMPHETDILTKLYNTAKLQHVGITYVRWWFVCLRRLEHPQPFPCLLRRRRLESLGLAKKGGPLLHLKSVLLVCSFHSLPFLSSESNAHTHTHTHAHTHTWHKSWLV